MTYELPDDVIEMTPQEVAEQLMNGRLEPNEKIGEVRLECGKDLEIDIEVDEEFDRTETFYLSDIQDEFIHGDYYTWALNEKFEDVLLCFGC